MSSNESQYRWRSILKGGRVLLFLLIISSSAMGQGWVLDVEVDINHNECAVEDLTSAAVSYAGTPLSIVSQSGSRALMRLQGDDGFDTQDKLLSIFVSGTCLETYDELPNLGTFSASYSGTFTFDKNGSCTYVSYYSNGSPTSVFGYISFYPRLDIVHNEELNISPTTSECGQVFIFNAISCGPYQWQLATSVDPPNFIDIPGKVEQTATVTTDALDILGDRYGIKYIRVFDNDLPWRSSATYFIHIKAPPPIVTLNKEDPLCYGGSTGKIKVSISGAANITNFKLTLFDGLGNPLQESTAGTYYEFTGLSSGNYYATVDNNTHSSEWGSCGTVSENIILSEPPPINLSFSKSNFNGYNVSCAGGSNGTLTVIPSGGSGGFHSYSWSNGGTSQSIGGLTATGYTVNLMDSHNCPASSSTTLSQPPALVVAANAATNYNGYAVSCHNKADGQILATASGGVGGYAYSWSSGESFDFVSGKGVGVYTVTVRDLNVCTNTDDTLLDAPPPIGFQINEVESLTCHGGEDAELEVVNVVNTIGAVHYYWASDGSNNPYQLGLTAGGYQVTVSDDQGCSATKNHNVIDPPSYTAALVPLSDFNGSPIQCDGDANGVISTLLTRDFDGQVTTPDYFVWSNGSSVLDEGPMKSSVSDLMEGIYKVEMTYNGQCKEEATITLSDPDPVIADIQIVSDYHGQPISCYGADDASLLVIGTGGTGTITYLWNMGNQGPLLNDIGAGSYSVIASDINGCNETTNQDLVDPQPVVASILSVSDYNGLGITCFDAADGNITAEGVGGTGVFGYVWNDGSTSPELSDVAAGDYVVTISDNNGCSDDANQAILSPLKVDLLVASLTNISCFEGNDGKVALEASGGTESFEFSINEGDIWQAMESFASLSSSTYHFTTRDTNGCTSLVSASLTEPDKLKVSISDILPAYCADPIGKAMAVATGGVSAYSYEWKNQQSDLVGTATSLLNVSAGVYTVDVTDAHQCVTSAQVAITSTDGAKTSWIADPAKCFDSSDGSAQITITEGDGPFVITWPDGQSELLANGLHSGDYFVEIQDSHDCTVFETVSINAPEPLALFVAESKMPTCYGYADGEILLSASGGVGGYIFEWNDSNGSTQTQLTSGDHAIKLIDGNQCFLQQAIFLAQPDKLTTQLLEAVSPTCHDGCDGSMKVVALGGNGDYQFDWGGLSGEDLITGICPGYYPLLVTDNKGCGWEEVYTLLNPPLPALDLGGGVTLCVGQTYTLDAGNNWVSYAWTSNNGFSSDQQRVTINNAGEYHLKATTVNGCPAEDIFVLETSLDLLQASFLIPNQAMEGDTIAMIDISWPLPETVEWTFPLTMTTIFDGGDVVLGQFNDAGSYSIGLTAHLGECVDYVGKSITILDDVEIPPTGRLGYEEYVIDFRMYPNPTDGNFEVGVELIEQGSITLSVWNSTTGVMMQKVSFDGDYIYKAEFDLRPLGFGAYVVRLDHQKGKEYIRFVVH